MINTEPTVRKQMKKGCVLHESIPKMAKKTKQL